MTLGVASGAGRRATLVWGGFALACAAGFVGAVPASLVLPFALTTAASVLVATAVRPSSTLPAGMVGLALVLGFLRGSLAVETPGPGTIDGNFGARPVVVTGVVRSADPGAGSSAIIDASHLSDADTDRAITGGVLVSGPWIPALTPGDRVEIDASGLRPLDRRPGPDSQDTLEREGVEGFASAPQVFVLASGGFALAGVIASAQARLITAVDREVSEPASALLLGIAFGIHQPLSGAVRTPLQDAGLIHIVVVSGLKVVLIVGLIAAAARAFEWSRRRTVLITIPVVATYVLISGAGPAAIRSALMAGAAMLAASGGRRTDPVPLLALVAAALLGLAPDLIDDPGFQLSFLGTAGILALAAPIATRLPGPRVLVEPFAVTIAAQVATLPIMAGTFGVLAVGGPFANALVLPLLPFMIVVGGSGAVLSALHPGLGWVLLQCASLGAWATTAIARAFAAVPGAAIQIGNWPAAWSIAELVGLLVAGAVFAAATHHRRPVAS